MATQEEEEKEVPPPRGVQCPYDALTRTADHDPNACDGKVDQSLTFERVDPETAVCLRRRCYDGDSLLQYLQHEAVRAVRRAANQNSVAVSLNDPARIGPPLSLDEVHAFVNNLMRRVHADRKLFPALRGARGVVSDALEGKIPQVNVDEDEDDDDEDDDEDEEHDEEHEGQIEDDEVEEEKYLARLDRLYARHAETLTDPLLRIGARRDVTPEEAERILARTARHLERVNETLTDLYRDNVVSPSDREALHNHVRLQLLRALEGQDWCPLSRLDELRENFYRGRGFGDDDDWDW